MHFSDYKGFGYASTSLKKQKLAFDATLLCIQLHGFTKWATELNSAFFSHEDQILIDHLERESAKNADIVISPSEYLINWAFSRKYILETTPRECIPNAYISLSHKTKRDKSSSPIQISELVFVGRHETRKSLDLFVQAIISNAEEIRKRNIQITIIGSFGTVNNTPSGLYLLETLGPTNVSFSLKTNFNRFQVIDYLVHSASPLVVVPSVEENSPYTVLEPIILNIPVITSNLGGAKELFQKADVNEFTFPPTSTGLAEKIASILKTGIRYCVAADTVKNTHNKWLDFLSKSICQCLYPPRPRKFANDELVTVGITHFERPNKLIDAAASILLQDHSNIEFLILDDGSKSQEAMIGLDYLEAILKRSKGRLIRQENAYLGAARNKLISEATGEFIVFLDDDNYAFPNMVSTLLQAIKSSDADIVTAQSIFLPIIRREELISTKGLCSEPVSYVPTGGPISLSGISNVFGDASAIYKKSVLQAIGGYSEHRNVGYEDFELFTKAALAGFKIQACPMPVYFYEVGRPSMLTKNCVVKDYQRVFKTIKSVEKYEEYVDFIELNIGKKAQELAWNLKHWEFSNHADADLLLPLLVEEKDKEKYLQCLLQLAVNRGFKNFISALLDSTSNWIPTLPETKKPLIEPDAGLHSSEEIEVMRSACWDENPNQFITGILSIIHKSIVVSRDILQILNIWMSRVDHEPALALLIRRNEAGALVEQLLTNKVPSEITSNILKNFLLALFRAQNCDAFSFAFEKIYHSEVENYANAYKDIKTVFAGDTLKPFFHFLDHGKKEGRKGFDVTFPILKYCQKSEECETISSYLRGFFNDNDDINPNVDKGLSSP